MPSRPILFVDDDPILLESVRRLTKKLPVAIRFASSAEEALRVIGSEEPLAIFADYRMDGLDGIALIEEIKRRYPKMPCILHTAECELPTAYGRDIPVLSKPCPPESLQTLLVGLCTDHS